MLCLLRFYFLNRIKKIERMQLLVWGSNAWKEDWSSAWDLRPNCRLKVSI